MSILKIPFTGPVDTTTLGEALKTLNLPGLGVVSQLSRETDADGKLVLGGDGRPVAVAPYVMVESGRLTAARRAAVEAAVAGHVPPAAPKPVMNVEDLWNVLRTKGVVADSDVPAGRRRPQ